MDVTEFLESIVAHSDKTLSNLLLRCKPLETEGDDIQERAPRIFKMRLTKTSSQQKLAPYIIHQVITTDSRQPKGEDDYTLVCLRSVCCAYYPENEEEGSMALLTMMERLRIAWLKERVIDGRFEIDMEQGIQTLIYPDDMGDFFAGEMVTYWKIPPVRREIGALYDYNW